jgi:hypothetical protein
MTLSPTRAIRIWLPFLPVALLASACAVRSPYSDACAGVSSNVKKALHYRSLDELKMNVAALDVGDRLDAFVYGVQCVHPPLVFLASTLVEEPRAIDETLHRLEGELDDSERFAYIELIRILHEKHRIDLNSDRQLRERVSKSIFRVKDEVFQARLLQLFAKDGVML